MAEENGNKQAEETGAPQAPAFDPTAIPTSAESRMAVVPYDPARGGLVPSDFVGLYRVATMLASSGMVPEGMAGKPAMVATAIQFGAEIGLGIMASVQNISVIKGKPALWGDAPLGICEASGELAEFSEVEVGAYPGDDYGYRCTAKRVKRSGQKRERSNTFTIADAKIADVWCRPTNSDKLKFTPWYRFPKRMLQLKARSWVLRDLFPDFLKGISMGEEIRDAVDLQPQGDGTYGSGPDDGLAAKTKARIQTALDSQAAPASVDPDPVGASGSIVDQDPDQGAAAEFTGNPVDLPETYNWDSWASDWTKCRAGAENHTTGFWAYVQKRLPWFVCCGLQAKRNNVSAERAINTATSKWVKLYGAEEPTPLWVPEMKRILDKAQALEDELVDKIVTDVAFKATGKHDRFQVRFALDPAGTVVEVDGQPVAFKIESAHTVKLASIPKIGRTVRIAVLPEAKPRFRKEADAPQVVDAVPEPSQGAEAVVVGEDLTQDLELHLKELKAAFAKNVESYYPGRLPELTAYLLGSYSQERDLEELGAFELVDENFGGFIQAFNKAKQKPAQASLPSQAAQMPAEGLHPTYVFAQLSAYKTKEADLYAAACKACSFGNQIPPTDAGRLHLFKKIQELRLAH